jgi:hypothetical protein
MMIALHGRIESRTNKREHVKDTGIARLDKLTIFLENVEYGIDRIAVYLCTYVL